MARRVERHDAVTAREQRIAQVDEARATTSPAVDEEDAGSALAPRPCGDPSRSHVDVNAPRLTQPRGHPLTDGPARRRAKQPLRPARREPGGGALHRAECETCESQSRAHGRSVTAT